MRQRSHRRTTKAGFATSATWKKLATRELRRIASSAEIRWRSVCYSNGVAILAVPSKYHTWNVRFLPRLSLTHVASHLDVLERHLFSRCFNTWYSSSHTCPTCRAPVKGPKDYHRIVYLQNEDKLHPTESHPSSDVLEGAEAKSAAFRTIDARIRLEIEEQKPSGRYGSKLDMLTKHLIFIGQESPLEKTIVFSAFKRGLDLVADALRHSESRRLPRDASLLLCLADDPVPTSRLLDGLRFAYADSSGRNTAIAVREFTTGDTSILLLHSETTSAGLNLVATKNVILLEPLVNSGTERQALGRVSRIGQTKETNVFLYFLKGSVEERILHLAAGRGQSLYLRDQEQGQERDSGALIAGHGSGSGNTREKGDCECRDGSGQGITKRHSRTTPLSPQTYTRSMTFSLASLQNTWVQGRGQLAVLLSDYFRLERKSMRRKRNELQTDSLDRCEQYEGG